MASFQFDPVRKRARFFFRFRGAQHNRIEPVETERHAERIAATIEDTILDVERGKLELPPGADIKTFLMTGGRAGHPEAEPEPDPLTIPEVFDLYFDTLTRDAKAKSSLSTERIHAKHFNRLFGKKRPYQDVTIEAAQRYVDKRSKEGVVRDTIKKELATLRYVWTWAAKRGHLQSPPPWMVGELTLPKGHEKPPFQTWAQIERRIARGDLTDDQRAELWESLWLDQKQTIECLAWVEAHAGEAFVHPLFCFAAFTGARRGEMLRSEREDWDFDGGIVRIRQKKADRSKRFTYRDVAIHPELAVVMQRWFAERPNDHYAVEHNGRIPVVQSTKWFRRTVDGGPWKVLRGYHVFRHSLASNMAAAGVDQRIIDATLGHSTSTMARRYRHLLPNQQNDAIRRLFTDPSA